MTPLRNLDLISFDLNNSMSTSAETKLAELIGSNLKIERILVDDILINFVVSGSGPNLLLLHGLNMGWGQWYPNIREFSRHFRVYAVDFPGAGGSTKIHPRTINFERHLVGSLEEFIRIKNLTPLNILGHSIGGWVALRLVLRKRSMINKIILVSPLGFSERTPWRYRLLGIHFLAQLLARTVMRHSRSNMKKFTESVFHDVSTLKEEFVDYYYESTRGSIINHPFLFLNRLAGFLKVRKEFVLLDELSKVGIPTLVILGEKDPIVSPTKKQSEAFGLIPAAQVEIFLNTGHVPSTEKSEEFNKLVIHFLKSN
ncbi:MAG: alpha/beta hydrolase [Patescibacteria group bacterium]